MMNVTRVFKQAIPEQALSALSDAATNLRTQAASIGDSSGVTVGKGLPEMEAHIRGALSGTSTGYASLADALDGVAGFAQPGAAKEIAGLAATGRELGTHAADAAKAITPGSLDGNLGMLVALGDITTAATKHADNATEVLRAAQAYNAAV